MEMGGQSALTDRTTIEAQLLTDLQQAASAIAADFVQNMP